MPAIAALRTALGALRRNPVLFLGGLVYAVVVLPQSALQLAGVPLAPAALQILTFFVTPFVIAGVVGMADEGIDGDTSLGTLRTVGANKYVPLLVGKFVEFAIAFAFGIALLITVVGVALTAGLGSVTGGAAGTGSLAIAGGAVLLVVLAFVVVSFFIQFFPVLIVVADADAVGSFTGSYRFVRRNLLATLGYALVRFVVGLVIAAPLTGFVLYRTFQNFERMGATAGGTPAGPGGFGGMSATPSLFSTPEVIAISLISVAVTMLGIAFQQSYAVAFYRRHADEETTESDEAADPANADVSRAADEDEWRYE